MRIGNQIVNCDRLSRWKYAVVLACFLVCGCSFQIGACHPRNWQGKYTIAKIERYRGGITSDEIAKSRVGSRVSICGRLYADPWVVVRAPEYLRTRDPISHEDGVVGRKEDSTTYGFFSSRDWIDQLLIKRNKNSDAILAKIEILPNSQLTLNNDGFMYFLRRSGGCHR